MIYGLISNFAVVGLFVSVWLFAKEELARRSHANRAVVLGVLLGLGSIATMAMAVRTDSGVLFDLRIALLATAAFIEGPIVVVIAGTAAIAYRFMSGGAGSLVGSLGILIAMLVGVAAHRWVSVRLDMRKFLPRALLVALAAAVLPNLAVLLLPHPLLDAAFGRSLLMTTALNFIGVLLVALAVWQGNLRLRERALLLAAISQAPDYFYVKDRQSRFVAVNKAVAAHHDPELKTCLVGKTDFDLETGRAEQLFSAEQDLMLDPDGRMHLRETVDLPSGGTRVYETTKVPVTDFDGQVIGLVGITHDITDAVAAENELHEDRRLLVSILSKMTDGVALFDEDARLVYCNDQYHAFFSLTQDVRVPGAELTAILRAAAERHEQPDIPQDDVEGWVESVARGMMQGGEEEVRLYDGRTVIARTRVVPGLGSVSVVSDITDMRLSEKRLAGLVDEMETLARTDALTGVVNRRAFDEYLDREVARGRRNREPVSLVILDVDHFKAFNDFHGHPEGDACLKRVANILGSRIRRGTDLLARYGGEEFCVILPNTEEEGALVFAEELRAAIEEAGIAHGASAAGVVTVSLGVATLPPGVAGLGAADLLKMADIALYGAKRSGRNRAMQYSRLLGSAAAEMSLPQDQADRTTMTL